MRSVTANNHPPESGWDRVSARYNLSQKMLLLMALVVASVLATAAFNANSTRQSIREVIDQALIGQVHSYQQVLTRLYRQDPKQFVARARDILEGARWGEGNSDYLFLAGHDGRLLVYPPDPSREGGFADPVPLENSNLNINEGLAQVASSGGAAVLRYTYRKPGGNKVLKDVYAMPVGDFVVAGGVYMDAADREMAAFLKRSALALLVSVALLGLWIFGVSKAIKGRVRRVMGSLRRISNRDLSQDASLDGKDEFAEVANGLEQTRSALAEVLATQRGSALTLASASLQMDNGMAQVGEAISSQRQRLETLASALEQMAGSTQEVAHNAQASASDTQHTATMVSEGMATLDAIIKAVRSLADDLSQSAVAVDEVQQGVQQIGSLAAAIDGISEQTNLLALNAAIEAARAGEQGRGFAVVADEVRQLAGHSQKTTRDIAGVIEGLSGHTRKAVSMIHGAVKVAGSTLGEVETARQEFEAINHKAGLISDHSTQIAAAAEQQSQVTEEVTRNLVGIRDAVEETEQVVAELHLASASLKGEAHTLEERVTSYQLP
ncbi:MAG: methyl-accepting chemotaxis protein [Pseudomonadota bacterium]|uniref:methyl-accepting chemotaxis protein n=1 Tax=Gallaecimonas pentaromativorans TaxID=584787 RepID=UPI00067F093D|nr:methyl-accepting chemotaxis protein [Gallaecimonas pentaromativorans]MED5525158.1 methyl-accepting chemotaxis protein [Pseudomonadota bacterium]